MTTIVTRSGKGSPLTNTELDANFSNLNADKLEHITSTITSSSTPTPPSDNVLFTITALAANATFSAPSGTPVGGHKLIIRIKDNGTARTLGFNAIYRAVGLTLPTTTVISKTMYIGCVYNSTDAKWDVTAVVEEA